MFYCRLLGDHVQIREASVRILFSKHLFPPALPDSSHFPMLILTIFHIFRPLESRGNLVILYIHTNTYKSGSSAVQIELSGNAIVAFSFRTYRTRNLT